MTKLKQERYFFSSSVLNTNESQHAIRYKTYDEAEAAANKSKITPHDLQTFAIYRETVEAVALMTVKCDRTIERIDS